MLTGKPYEKFAEIYDSIMPDRFYRNYYHFITKIFRELKFKPSQILDMACGTGKLTKIFSDKGYRIVGLDCSEKMLDIARRKGIECYQRNMVNFHLDKKFDLVLCTYDSLNYIKKSKDLQKCFSSVNKHLNKNGLFIFDMNSDFKINKVIPTSKAEYHRVGETELIWLNSHKPNTWIAEMIMFSKKKNRDYQRFYERHIEKAYKLSEIKKLLSRENFKIVSVYSDFNFGKVKVDSERWFFVTRKR